MERITGDRMAKVKGIIFDLDGTLVRLPVDWRRVLNTIEEMLGTKVKSLIGICRNMGNKDLRSCLSQS